MRQAGLIWGLTAGLAYASMNLCLRATAVQTEPFVGALIRAGPVVLLGWTMLAWQCRTHRPARPSARATAALVAVGLLFNVTGNGSFQFALAQAGLTVTVPVSSGAVLWGGAAVGWWLLRERLTLLASLGLLFLVAAMPLLTVGASGGGGLIWLGALAACLAGLSYGGGNALLRQTVVTNQLSQGLALAIVPCAGLVGLAGIVIVQHGPAALIVDRSTLVWLLVAGCFNAVALGSLSRALTTLPTTRVNALSTLQTAISALGGIVIFGEPLTLTLLAGLALSLVGVILSQRRSPSATTRPPTDQASPDPAAG